MKVDLKNLRKLRELAEDATPGPWTTGRYDELYSPELYVYGPKGICEGCVGNIKLARDEDALFIAAANPQTVLELLDEHQRLIDRLQEIEAYCAKHQSSRQMWAQYIGALAAGAPEWRDWKPEGSNDGEQ